MNAKATINKNICTLQKIHRTDTVEGKGKPEKERPAENIVNNRYFEASEEPRGTHRGAQGDSGALPGDSLRHPGLPKSSPGRGQRLENEALV